MCKKLGLENLTPTRMSVSLVDKSTGHLREVIDEVLVKVKDLVFLVGFIILDIEEDVDFPFILGRPYLYTSRALWYRQREIMHEGWTMKSFLNSYNSNAFFKW